MKLHGYFRSSASYRVAFTDAAPDRQPDAE